MTPMLLLMLLASTLAHARPIVIHPDQASTFLRNGTTFLRNGTTVSHNPLPEESARAANDIVRIFIKKVGSSCATVTPGYNEECCARKVAENTFDSWCAKNSAKT